MPFMIVVSAWIFSLVSCKCGHILFQVKVGTFFSYKKNLGTDQRSGRVTDHRRLPRHYRK
jgi:hypothetical protein